MLTNVKYGFALVNGSMGLFKYLFPKPVKSKIIDPFSTIIRLSLISFKPVGTKLCIDHNRIYLQEPNVLQGTVRTIHGDQKDDLHNLCIPIQRACEQFLKKTKSDALELQMLKNKDNEKNKDNQKDRDGEKDKSKPHVRFDKNTTDENSYEDDFDTDEKIKKSSNDDDTRWVFNKALEGLSGLAKTYSNHKVTQHCIQHYKLIIKNYMTNTSIQSSSVDEVDIKNDVYDKLDVLWSDAQMKIVYGLLMEMDKLHNEMIEKPDKKENNSYKMECLYNTVESFLSQNDLEISKILSTISS
jgi:hypothetical protein